MNVAVIGYGLIGKERVSALQKLKNNRFAISRIAVLDPYFKDRTDSSINWLDSMDDLSAFKADWIIVAVPHDIAVDTVKKILPLGCKVLVEKPLGRSAFETKQLISRCKFENQLWAGFNYRFFPGIAQAISDAQKGVFGKIISVNMVLGHGGAPGMGKGWKFDPVKAGGGCLIDPGIHLLDLCYLLSPKSLVPLNGWSWSGFWNTGIEEEVHMVLQGNQFVINIQVSIVRWRSTFRMEINGTEGYGIVTGRGRSYGPQQYIRGKRWGWQKSKTQADSEEQVLTSDCNDSFLDEMHYLFSQDHLTYLLPACSANETLNVMGIYDACLQVI